MDVALSISEGLARNVLSAKVNGKTVEASTPITNDADLTLLTWNDKEGKTAFWHSSAHVLAQTLEHLYPGVKLTIGPAIENGFYYDVTCLRAPPSPTAIFNGSSRSSSNSRGRRPSSA